MCTSLSRCVCFFIRKADEASSSSESSSESRVVLKTRRRRKQGEDEDKERENVVFILLVVVFFDDDDDDFDDETTPREARALEMDAMRRDKDGRKNLSRRGTPTETETSRAVGAETDDDDDAAVVVVDVVVVRKGFYGNEERNRSIRDVSRREQCVHHVEPTGPSVFGLLFSSDGV